MNEKKTQVATITNGNKSKDIDKGQGRALYAVVAGRSTAKNRFKVDIGFIRLVAKQAPDAVVKVQQFSQVENQKKVLTHESTMLISNVWKLAKTFKVNPDGSPTDTVGIGNFIDEFRTVVHAPDNKKNSGISAEGLLDALDI